jgi:choline-glycine betaine transporter
MNKEDQHDHPGKVTFLSSILSACFAAFGVQSKKNLERDFQHKKPSIFIYAGIIFVILFVGVVYTVVQLVLSSAGVN